MSNPDICELCGKNPLPDGRYFSHQYDALRVCPDCYYFAEPPTCKQISKVLDAIRQEILFYERTAPQLYKDWKAEKEAAERAKEEEAARANRHWPYTGRVREG